MIRKRETSGHIETYSKIIGTCPQSVHDVTYARVDSFYF